MSGDFTGYDKIPASTAKWQADEATMRRLSRLKWTVCEKIHGASFCFILQEGRIQCASRRSIIAPDDGFFGHRRVLGRLHDRLEQLYRSLSAAHPDAPRFLVYGELYGGKYPHPQVAAVSGVQAIQTGVWYLSLIHI